MLLLNVRLRIALDGVSKYIFLPLCISEKQTSMSSKTTGLQTVRHIKYGLFAIHLCASHLETGSSKIKGVHARVCSCGETVCWRWDEGISMDTDKKYIL